MSKETLDRSQLLEGSTETSSERFEPVQLEKDLGYSSDNDYKKHRKPPNQCSKPKVDNDRKDGKPSNLGSIPKFPYHGSRPVKGIGGWHLLSLDFRKLKKEFMKTPQDLNKDEVGESFKKEFVTYTGRNESNPDKKKKRFRWNRESKKIDKSIDAEITLNSSETPFSFDTDESSFVLKTPERMGHGEYL
ncbi:hypothetical protein DFH28DRAFT_1217070 [Melampsora americana]|nr:hypothetical protein DFH28DRAFT_1217070 [Melampsora americana]